MEETDFQREKLTLANYFYKMQRQYPLSEAQKPLYAVLGDVNPEYALKYMTTFLLKYVRKAELMQKRRDIFVDSLVILGYIRQNEAGKYELQASFDKERLIFQLDWFSHRMSRIFDLWKEKTYTTVNGIRNRKKERRQSYVTRK